MQSEDVDLQRASPHLFRFILLKKWSCRIAAEQAVIYGIKRKFVISSYGNDDIFPGL